MGDSVLVFRVGQWVPGTIKKIHKDGTVTVIDGHGSSVSIKTKFMEDYIIKS